MSPSPGGVGRYTAKLVSNLAALGVDVKTVVARHTPEEVQSAWAEFDLGALPGPTVLPLPRAALYDSWHLLGWPPLSRGADVDLLHAPSLAVPPKDGKPLVVSVHDAAPWLFPASFPLRGRWFHHAGVRAATRRADRVLTGTEAAASELRAHTSLPAERLRVIPYGVDHPYAVADPEVVWTVLQRYDLHDRQYVLWVGSLEPRKGLATLVSAVVKLAQKNSAPTLVLAGYTGWRNANIISPEDRAVLARPCENWGGCANRSCRPSTPARVCSLFRVGTKVSGCPCSRPWWRVCRWWPPTYRPFVRWPLTPPFSFPPVTQTSGPSHSRACWGAHPCRPNWRGQAGGGRRSIRGRGRPRRRSASTRSSPAGAELGGLNWAG